MRSDDELDGLRRAWDALEAPDSVHNATQADAQERAAIEWMRAAWERVEPPVPTRLRGPAVEQGRRWAWIAAAAAAGLAGLWFAFAPTGASPPGPSSSPEPEIARPEPRGDSVAPEEDPTAPPKVQVARVTSDRMELRSGSVRLILLTESAGPAAPRSEDG